MSKLPIRLAMLCAMLPLMSCATMMVSGETKATFCQIAKPIYWSVGDTDATIAQAKEQNAVGVKLCGWGKK